MPAVDGIAVPKFRARAALRWRTRLCAALLSFGLAVQPVFAQAASSARPAPEQAAPARLEIKVLTPVPMSEPAGALSANRIAVRIVDGWGMPVPGATVSFRLPEAGPGGVFLNGLSTEIAISDREGGAAVQGFEWRAEPGTSFLHIIAAYGAIRTGAMVELQLTPNAPNAAVASESSRASSEAANPSSFPLPSLPGESRAARRAAAPSNGHESSERPTRDVLGRQADEATPEHSVPGAAVPNPRAPAPREMRAEALAEDDSAANAANPPAYVTVKRKSGGGKTLLILGVVAAAAGGALVAGMVSRGSSSGTGGNGGPNPADIVIGSPSITVSGAGR